jgi:hypothetical protein
LVYPSWVFNFSNPHDGQTFVYSYLVEEADPLVGTYPKTPAIQAVIFSFPLEAMADSAQTFWQNLIHPSYDLGPMFYHQEIV